MAEEKWQRWEKKIAILQQSVLYYSVWPKGVFVSHSLPRINFKRGFAQQNFSIHAFLQATYPAVKKQQTKPNKTGQNKANQPTNQPNYQPNNQTTKRSTNHQPENKTTQHPTIQPTNKTNSTNHTKPKQIKPSQNKTRKKQTKQINHPTNQPTNPPMVSAFLAPAPTTSGAPNSGSSKKSNGGLRVELLQLLSQKMQNQFY